MDVDRIAVSELAPPWHKQAAESLGLDCIKIPGSTDDLSLVDAAREIGALWGTARTFTRARDLRAKAESLEVKYVGARFSDAAPNDVDAQRALATTLDIPVTREPIDRPRTLAFPVARADGEFRFVHEWELCCFHNQQPLMAEAPSPLLLSLPDGEAMREALIEYVRRFTDAIDLHGVGCAYFAIDSGYNVTFEEFLLGVRVGGRGTQLLDQTNLFALELLLGTGQPMPEQTSFADFGHVVEAVVPGKAPKGFKLPQGKPGKLHFLRNPVEGRIAQITALERVRHRAILQLDRAIALTLWPEDCADHVRRLRAVLSDEAFRAGQYDRTL